MAKKKAVSKTQAVRDYLAANPEAGPTVVVAVLKKQGIKITANYVSGIKGKLKKAGKGKRTAKTVTVVAEAPAAVDKPAKNGDTITLEQVKKVAKTIKAMGGFQRMTEMLEVIKEAGGVKKFRDLAEAMTAAEPDAIPF